jgi:hypothetical protein
LKRAARRHNLDFARGLTIRVVVMSMAARPAIQRVTQRKPRRAAV